VAKKIIQNKNKTQRVQKAKIPISSFKNGKRFGALRGFTPSFLHPSFWASIPHADHTIPFSKEGYGNTCGNRALPELKIDLLI
jgi:hypothetical protein